MEILARKRDVFSKIFKKRLSIGRRDFNKKVIMVRGNIIRLIKVVQKTNYIKCLRCLIDKNYTKILECLLEKR